MDFQIECLKKKSRLQKITQDDATHKVWKYAKQLHILFKDTKFVVRIQKNAWTDDHGIQNASF